MSLFTRPISEEELQKGISTLHANKAAGIDDIRSEQIKHTGSVAQKWLLDMFNNCIENTCVQKQWLRTKVVAILKPGKDSNEAKNFRPISLLCQTYKLLERLILNRIGPHVDNFSTWPNTSKMVFRTTSSQVQYLWIYLQLMTLSITKGYGQNFMTSQMTSNSPDSFRRWCKTDASLSNLMGRRADGGNRKTVSPRVASWRQHSTTSTLLTSLQQRTLETSSMQMTPASQPSIVPSKLLNSISTQRSQALSEYYRANYLRANPSKTQVCVFHLKNREAKRELKLKWNNVQLNHCEHPVYLGVKLDRTLSFKKHIEKTIGKVESRNATIGKLVSSTLWRWPQNCTKCSCCSMHVIRRICLPSLEQISPCEEAWHHTQ